MPPGRWHSQRQKCHGLMEQLVGNNTDKCLTISYGRMAGTMIQRLAAVLPFGGDALNVAHLVPLSRRLSRTGLVDALMAHYGSPGRLADYRRQFEGQLGQWGRTPPYLPLH